MQQTISNYLLLVTATLTLGCSSPQASLFTSLEGLTSAVDRKGYSDQNQNLFLSIAGLLAQSSPGEIIRYKKGRAPSTLYGIRTSSGKSYYRSFEIPFAGNQDDLLDIRDALVDVQTEAAKALHALFQRSRVRVLSPDDAQAISKAEQAYVSAREKYDEEFGKAAKMIRDSGVMLFRWNVQSSAEGGFKLGDLLGGSGSKETSAGGFVLVGGLRHSTLFVSETDLDSLKNKAAPWIPDGDKKNIRLTTHTLQARYLLYLSDYSSASTFKASLKASYEQLADLPEALRALDEIEADLILSSAESLSNTAYIADSDYEDQDVDFLNPSNPDLEDGWETLYAVDVKLEDLLDELLD